VAAARSWTANSLSIGGRDGRLYKSTSFGLPARPASKSALQLRAHFKIIVDPRSATPSMPAAGKLWSDSPERGMYKTKDGGGPPGSVISKGATSGDRLRKYRRFDPRARTVMGSQNVDFRRKGWIYRSGGEGRTAFSCERSVPQPDGPAQARGTEIPPQATIRAFL